MVLIFGNNRLWNVRTRPSTKGFTCIFSFHLPSSSLVCISQGGLRYAVVTNTPDISAAWLSSGLLPLMESIAGLSHSAGRLPSPCGLHVPGGFILKEALYRAVSPNHPRGSWPRSLTLAMKCPCQQGTSFTFTKSHWAEPVTCSALPSWNPPMCPEEKGNQRAGQESYHHPHVTNEKTLLSDLK